MAIKKEIEITINSKDAVKGIKDVDSGLKDVKNSSTTATDAIGSSALGFVKSFKLMGVSVGDLIKYLKVFKITLISTGIGAIVVAVGALAAAFMSTQAGVDALNSVLTPLKTVLGTIWGIVQDLSKGFAEMLSGDIIGGWNKMGTAIEGVGDKMDEAWEKGKRLHELQIQIRDNEINEITAVTDLNIQRAKALEIAEDDTQTIKDRQKAYKEAIGSENAIAAIKKTILQAKIDELRLSQSINDTSSDEYKNLVQLEADLKNAEYQRLTSTTALTKRLNRVKGEKIEGEKQTGERKSVKKLNVSQANDVEQELLASRLINETKILEDRETQDKINYYRNLVREEDRIADEEAAEKKKQLEQDVANAKISIAQNGLSLVGELAKKGSKLGKAVAIAQATISAYEGTQNAFTTANKSPITAVFPAYPFIQAGLAGAFGAVNVAKIASAKEVGASGGLTTSTSGANVAAPSFNLVQGTQGDQIANSINQNNKQPLKAYVVSGDVTSQQSLDRNAKTNASL